MTDQPAFMAMADNQKKNYKAETTILDFGKEDVRALINNGVRHTHRDLFLNY